ncbi:MAG: ArsR/SmtB family transcription factor [Candidatus Micrarchaeaceae archaeon]
MGTLWKALADDSRRQVLLMLIDGEKSPSEMAAKFDFTMSALSTHLRILKDAGLVIERREGQHRIYSLNADGMNELFKFVDAFWAHPLHNLKHYFKGRRKRRN